MLKQRNYLKLTITSLLLCLGLLQLNACSNISTQESKTVSVNDLELKNFHNPEKQVYTSGQPSKEQLTALAGTGVKHIVNLREKSEQDWNEAELVKSLGMEYHLIEVAGIAGVNQGNAHKLSDLLAKLSGEPVLLHCASGNRVGGLIALREGLLLGKDTDSAIETGKQWGLTRLEPIVREKLSEEK